jgi:tripartite-type tricarboxylate transporter receptor subunit TctC
MFNASRRTLIQATGSGLVLFSAGVSAQQRLLPGTVKIVVPFPPGGITDVLARGLAQQMTTSLGTPVVVENRAGANGSIGATQVARATPDGLTLLLGVTDTHAVNPAAMRNLAYDANRDFAPISNVTSVPLVLAVGPTLKDIANLQAFIAAAKKQPGKLTHASWGVGSTSHIAMLRVGDSAGIELLHVPYTGAAPAAQALIAGQVDSLILPAGAAESFARDGRLRVLAVLSPKRLALLPDVPTLAEQGVALSVSVFQAMFAPAGTPPAVIALLNKSIESAVQSEAFLKTLQTQAALATPTTPEALGELVRNEQEAWGRIIRAGNIRLD